MSRRKTAKNQHKMNSTENGVTKISGCKKTTTKRIEKYFVEN